MATLRAPRSALGALRQYFPWRRENPVLSKELRTRIRGVRSFWLQAGYVLILGILVSLAYLAWWTTDRITGAQASGSRLGETVFLWVFLGQAFFISVIPPALTAGAVTLEREQKTLELLAISTLKGREVVMGKLLPGYLMVLLLLFISAPVAGLSFLFGGVAPFDLVTAYAALGVYGFAMASTGIFWSCLVRGTAGSVVVTFITVFVYLVATAGMAEWLRESVGATPGGLNAVPFLSTLSPFVILRMTDATVPVFGAQLPALVGPLLVYALAGSLLVAVASTKVEFLREDRAPWVRALTLALSLAVLFCVFGNAWSFYALSATPSLAGARNAVWMAMAGLGLVVLLAVPVLATGDRRAHARPFRWSDPRQWFTSRPAGGVWFLLLWVALGAAVVAGCLALGGFVPADPALWETFGQVTALVAATVFGVAAVGWAVSARAGRGLGVAVALLAIFFLVAMPASVWPPPGPWRQPLQSISAVRYLTPVTGFAEVEQAIMGTAPGGPRRQGWLITSGIYILIGAAALGIGGSRRRYA